MQDPFQPTSAQPRSVPGPNEEWKRALAMTLEVGLRSVADEVKEQINDELARERERLDADQHVLLETIRQLGNEQLQIALEREWQERWWAAGCSPDQAWPGSVISEQQAILDEIEARRNVVPAASSQPNSPWLSPPEIHPSLPLLRSFQLRPAYHPAGPTSTPSLSNDKVEHINGSEFGSRSTTPTAPTDSTIRPNPGMNTRPIVHEIWKPSVTREDDAEISRTFRLATRASSTVSAKPVPSPPTSPPFVNTSVLPLTLPAEDAQISRSSTPMGRSEIGSDTSYFKAPCTLSVAFTEPLDALSSNVHRESSSVQSAVRKWMGSSQAQEGDSNDPKLGDHVGFSLPQAPRYATCPLPEDSSCVHVPPSSEVQPVLEKKESVPSSMPGEDGQISHVLAPEIWEQASATPLLEAPCTLSVAFTDPLDALSSNVHRESSSVQSAVRKWIGSSQAQEGDSDDQKLGDHVGFSLPQVRRYATCPLPEDSSCVHVPPSSEVQSVHEKKESVPSSMPGEDGQISHVLPPEIWDQASTTPLLEAPCTLSVAFTDPLEALSENMDREQSIYSADQGWTSSDRTQEGDGEGGISEHGHTDDRSVHSSNQTFEDAISRPPTPPPSSTTRPQLWNNSRARVPDTQPDEEGKWMRSRELEMKRKEEELKRKEREVNSREIAVGQKEEDIRRKEAEVRIIEKGAKRKESEAKRKKEAAERKEEEVQRRTKETILKAEEIRRKEEELRKREDELGHREDVLNRREAEMRRREDDRLREEEESRRQRVEEVRERWIPAWLRPTPSPRVPYSSGPDYSGRNTPAAASPPTDGVGTSASSHSSPTSDISLTSTQPTSITNSQLPSHSKPTGPVNLTPKPPTSSTPNPPPKDAEFHRRQVRQTRRHEDQPRRGPTRSHERQAEAGRTMSKEETTKLFEAHSDRWSKIQTSRSLTWEDFPWPTFKQPKGPNDLTLRAISEYMLSPFHPQDRGTKEHIKDHIRRWHPDRVNSRLLPKVKESERARVSEGVKSVERILNDLLRG